MCLLREKGEKKTLVKPLFLTASHFHSQQRLLDGRSLSLLDIATVNLMEGR
jgi:hypothetical protein